VNLALGQLQGNLAVSQASEEYNMAPGTSRDKSKSKSKSRERKGECFLCSRPSANKCPACQLVHYCSQDHLLTHRQQNYCFPFRVRWRSGKGRCLVATRDIAPLELIMFDAAIVHGPQNNTVPVCLECNTTLPADHSYLCGMCNMPVCGEDCQVGAAHYNECQIFRTLREKVKVDSYQEPNSPMYQCITPLRLLMKKNTHPKWFRRLQFLMDHREAREEEEKMWTEHQRNVVDFLLQSCNLNYTTDEIMWAVGVLKTNSITFGETGGRALFPMFSLINHSCSANTKHTIYIRNRRIAVQAQTAISCGEEILINYVPFIHGTVSRQAKLLRNWYFSCTCPRCSDPTELGSHLSSLVCQKCPPGEGVLTQVSPLSKDSPWKCSVHQCLVTKENVTSMCRDLKDYIFRQEASEGGVARLEEVLIELSQFLHPHHNLMMIIKRNIISLYSTLPLKSVTKTDFSRIKQLCEESIAVLGKVDPGYPLWKAETLKDLSTSMMNLARTNFEEGVISRPQFLAEVKSSMKMVETASNCKSCIKVERKMEDGEVLKEEYVTS